MEEIATERKDWRREEMKEGPTSLTVRVNERRRERRDDGGGGERDFLMECNLSS